MWAGLPTQPANLYTLFLPGFSVQLITIVCSFSFSRACRQPSSAGAREDLRLALFFLLSGRTSGCCAKRAPGYLPFYQLRWLEPLDHD
jgi:hypothetical protein